MTPNIERIWREVHKRWPDVRSLGVFNCRKIANSSTWSQHAWRNAWDISSPNRVLLMGPRTRLNPLHMAYMDKIVAHLKANRQTYNIRTLLWRTTAHWDHAHVDPWPRGVGNPPCNGGPLQVQDRDGTISDNWGEEDMAKAVEGIQTNLNKSGFADPLLVVDGDWGPKTEAAHKAMCDAAAANPGIEPHTHQLVTVSQTGPIS